MHATLEYRPSGSLAKLLLKNAALNLITLTIYRFWAKTRVRQYFWHAVRLDGEPLEYTGLGRELLIGFLIVLAVLAPATLVWSTAQTLLHADPVGLAVAQGIYFFLLYVLIDAARFRARRYRLSRTLWRGIRAGQDGSTLRYVVLSLAWGLAAGVTFGLATPWMRVAQQRYMMVHTRFGDRFFSFSARGRDLLVPWLMVLVPTLLFYAMLLVAFWGVWSVSGDKEASAKFFDTAFATKRPFLLAAPLLLIAAGAAWAWYRIAEFRYFVASTGLGEISAVSRARIGPIFGRILLFLGVFFLFIALTTGLLTVTMSTVWHLFTGRDGDIVAGLPLALLLAGITAFLLRRFWWTLIFTSGLIRHLCETLEISGAEGLSLVGQSAASEQKYGEGLADSFEVAG